MKALPIAFLGVTFVASLRVGLAAEVPTALLHSILAPPVGVQQGARFGHSVAVDGGYTVVGIPWDASRGFLSGLVKVFDSSTGALVRVLPNPGGPGYFFGMSVAISGTRVAVGAPGAVRAYVFDLASGDPTVPVARMDNPSYDSRSGFGSSIAISGTRMVIGAPTGGDRASFSDETRGIGYVYDLASATPTLPVTLKNPGPAFDDRFGFAVALSGTRVLVSAPKKESGATNSGSVYVFDLAGGTPTVPAATLNNPVPNYEDQFGISVAISGTRVVVGEEPREGVAVNVYVYDLGSGTPTVPVATLSNPAPLSAARNKFGTSVAISGTRVVVGAYDAAAPVSNAGSAFVYELSTPTPTVPVLTLSNPAPAVDDHFAGAVAISGTRVVVGAELDDTAALDAGSAYLYDLASATPSVPVSAVNDPGLSASDHFGWSVAVAGTQVLVGAPHDDTGASDAGSAYVYDLTTATPTVPNVALHNPSAAHSELFGYTVALEGRYVVVGAPKDDAGSGSVYVYDLNGGTPTIPMVTLTEPGGPFRRGQFGSALALSGTLVVVGGASADTKGLAAEKVYVYDLARATPATPVAVLSNPFPLEGDQFGISVGISGSRVVVGAHGDDVGATDGGSAYTYDLSSATPTVPIVELENPFPAVGAKFGRIVAISGTRVVVVTGNEYSGSTYVYDLGSATPTTRIASLPNYGSRPAASGTFVALGNPYDGMSFMGEPFRAGMATVFDFAMPDPTAVALMPNPTPAPYDLFGQAIAIEGSILAIGAPYDDTVMFDKGAVYIYGPSAPEILIAAQPGHTALVDGGNQSVGSVFVNGAASLGFTVRNIGAMALTGLATSIDGPNAADFSIVRRPVAPVNGPNGSTSFTVRFSPGSLGLRTATLHIATNDADERSFDITLTGIGIESVSRVVDQGAPVSFSVEVPGTATVQWRKDGVELPGAVGSTLSFGSVQPWQVGVYSARVTTAAGSSVRDVAVLGLTGVPSGRGAAWFRATGLTGVRRIFAVRTNRRSSKTRAGSRTTRGAEVWRMFKGKDLGCRRWPGNRPSCEGPVGTSKSRNRH